jgi:glucokinase
MNSRFLCAGRLVPRTGLVTYDLEDAEQRARFVGDDARMLQVPGTMRSVRYRDAKPVGVGLSRLGASRAAAVGAYAVALRGLDESGR